MTGSGKTGLLITLLKKPLYRASALIIDPKGDLTNLMLHFPDLKGEDFAPWIDPDIARRKNITDLQAGSEEATRSEGWPGCLGAGVMRSWTNLTKKSISACIHPALPPVCR